MKKLTNKILTDLHKDLKSINSRNKKNFFYINHDNKTICFLVISSYFSIINPSNVRDDTDVEMQLNRKSFENKNKIIKLWHYLQKNHTHSLTGQVCLALSKFALNEYSCQNNDKVLISWVCEHWFNDQLLDSPDNFRIYCSVGLLDLVENCQDYLHVNINEGNYLVSGGEWTLIKRFFTNESYYNRKVTFYNNEFSVPQIQLLLCFFDEFSHYEFVKRSSEKESERIFNFENARFNHIIFFGEEGLDRINEDEVVSFVADGGTCLTFNLSKDNPLLGVNSFIEYETPLMFDTGTERCAFYHKVPVKENLVRYFTNYANSEFAIGQMFREIETIIKTHGESNYYTEVPKEDFLYRKSSKFIDIRRPEDQKTFVWRKISDIIIEIDDQEEPLNNTDISPDRIFKTEDFPTNPFKLSIDKRFYLSGFKNISADGKNVSVDAPNFHLVGNVRESDASDYSTDNNTDILDDNSSDFKRRCYKLVNSKVLLKNTRGYFARINASYESPLCFHKYHYFQDDYIIRKTKDISVVRINEAYDEQFIIYQFMTGYRLVPNSGFIPEYMLVAQTKEEQHTYYINKRNDNQKQYEYIVDEIEAEKLQSLNYSTAKIGEIGFRNFRRLKNMYPINLAEVTMLVGANNTGKSTLVKGLLLIIDNIKSLQYDKFDGYSTALQPKFRMDANMYHDLHIGTFNRALSDGEEDDRTIDFFIKIAHFDIKITIESKESVDVTSVPVILISINDHKRRVGFDFDFKNDSTKAIFEVADEVLDINTSLPSLEIDNNRSLIASLVRFFADYPDTVDSKTVSKIEQNNKNYLKGKEGFIKEIADELDALISVSSVEYIYAHAATQKFLYNYNDKNDYMAQTLHEFYNERIQRDSIEHDFIIEWMNEEHFNIGVDYDLITISGEAYQMKIKKSDGKMKSLSDLGMGSNQLVILLLRLATIMHRNRIQKITGYRPTIVIEEPEQNLHPSIQSKLVELFYVLNEKYKIRFIVETHSEYIIRKAQVLVGDMEYKTQEEVDKKNPFKVFFFPSNGVPYNMGMAPTGKFLRNFDEGFFDVAAKLNMEVIRKERKK